MNWFKKLSQFQFGGSGNSQVMQSNNTVNGDLVGGNLQISGKSKSVQKSGGITVINCNGQIVIRGKGIETVNVNGKIVWPIK